MKKIGIFLDEIKDKSIDEKQKFSKLGFNTGNMLFWHSLKTQLNLDVKSRWYIDHIDQLDLTEYKAFITTDLIWIRQMQDFSYLNKTLDVIGDLPLIPISIGLQCDSYDYSFKLHPDAVKVIKRIEQRCVMGVRGEYTAQILRQHGITNFMVIGCPSMYMNAPGLLTVNNNGQPRRVTMNFETFYSKLDEKRISLLEYGMENQFSFVEQAQSEISKKQIADKKRLSSISEWLKNYGKCFFDINEWRGYIKEKDFSIGSRFHGNVLALWEGVPALFITCDSRTQELCEHFSLPHIDIKDFDSSKPIEFYYKSADYTDFASVYSKRLEEWKEFLHMNKLINSDGIVVYQVGHLGFLINCFLHKLSYHKTAHAFFLIDKVIAGPTSVKNLESISNNFEYLGKIIFYNDRDIINMMKENQDNEQLICSYFDKLLSDNDIKLSTVSEFYSIFDTYNAFAVYLSLKEKEFNIIEPVGGSCRTHARYHLNTSITPIYDEIIEKYSVLSADSKFCKMLYSYDSCDYNGKETVYNNSPVDLMEGIDDSELKKLSKAYSIKIESTESQILLILNSGWLCGANGLKFPDGYFYLYKKIIDFYLPDKKLVLKPHPNTDFDIMTWKSQFPNFDIIPGFYPSFLIKYIDGLNVSSIISTGSSGGKGVTNKEIDFKVFQSYKLLNKFYVALLLAQSLFIPIDKVYHYGVHNSFAWSIEKATTTSGLKSEWSKLSFEDDSFTIIDNINWNPGNFRDKMIEQLRKTKNNSIVVFLNGQNDFAFITPELDLLPDIYEMRLEKTRTSFDSSENMNDEVIYIFCRDRERIEMMKHFYLKHVFKQSCYALIVNGLCTDKHQNTISIKTDLLFSNRNSDVF